MADPKPTQPCPECGCDMHRAAPKRNSKDVILYYRRWQCTSCPHYEASTVNIGRQKKQPLTLEEIENFKNQNADRYYPKDNMLLKKQGLNRNTKEL